MKDSIVADPVKIAQFIGLRAGDRLL